ncbi:hypothetical protein AAE478_006558 [Parahypoxylon ruwenzoriense]
MSPQLSTTDTTFSRPVGNLEAFFKVLSDNLVPEDREHWTISLPLKLRFPPYIGDPTSYLSRAWQALRLQHPALGATLSPQSGSDPKGGLMVSISPYDPDSWVNDTFIRRDEKDASTLFSKLFPTATATCYWLPTAGELVLRSSHWCIDGVGMVRLGHNFLTILASILRLGTEAALDSLVIRSPVDTLISPSLEELIRQKSNIPPGSEEDPILAEGADILVGEFIRGVPSIGLPTRADPTQGLSKNSLRVSTHLSSSTTAKVVAACRAKGLKVTSAVHAAIVLATAGFSQHPLSKSYTAFAPVDLRRALTATAGPEEEHGSRVTGLYFSGLPVCVEGILDANGKISKDFDTVAREINAVYSRDLVKFWSPDDGSGKTFSLPDLAESYLRRTTALLSAPAPEVFPPVQTPDLSSLGKVETHIQRDYVVDGDTKIEVVDCWLATEMLTRNVQFHVWSWRDELTLGACFNNSFYEESFVVEVLDKVIEQLLVGCGVGKS